jgi:hypothetical protein
VTPLRAPANGGHSLGVEAIGDCLERHALRAHLCDTHAELRVVDHRRAPRGTASAARGLKTAPRSLAEAFGFPARHFDKQVRRQTPIVGVGVQPLGDRHEARIRAPQRLDQLSELGHRMGEATQLGHHQPRCLTSAYPLERVRQAGAVRCLPADRLAVVYDLD